MKSFNLGKLYRLLEMISVTAPNEFALLERLATFEKTLLDCLVASLKVDLLNL